jgi:hypothetical protein
MLKLQPDPTFTKQVDIPTPWGVQTIKIEFKYRDAEEFESFTKNEGQNPRGNEAVIMDIAVGWFNVDAEFNAENVKQLCKKYHQAATVIVETYIKENTQARLGN